MARQAEGEAAEHRTVESGEAQIFLGKETAEDRRESSPPTSKPKPRGGTRDLVDGLKARQKMASDLQGTYAPADERLRDPAPPTDQGTRPAGVEVMEKAARPRMEIAAAPSPISTLDFGNLLSPIGR